MTTAIYGLAAKGQYAIFQGTGTVLCKKFFVDREEAKAYEPTFLNKCCDGSLGALDITSAQIYITEHELVQANQNSWLPIDVVPKNGERVLVFRKGYAESKAVCWWNSVEQVFIAVGGNEFYGATHWMPLPMEPE